MDYFVVRFVDGNVVKYAIWYTDVQDGFVCENGKMYFFDSIKLLKDFCDTKKIIIVDEDESPSTYDLGYLKKWLSSPADKFECSIMLDFWNIISDALKSIGVEFTGDNKENEAVNQVYFKLFHGCNLPAINTIGKKYVPKWTQVEIDCLATVLSEYKFFWF